MMLWKFSPWQDTFSREIWPQNLKFCGARDQTFAGETNHLQNNSTDFTANFSGLLWILITNNLKTKIALELWICSTAPLLSKLKFRVQFSFWLFLKKDLKFLAISFLGHPSHCYSAQPWRYFGWHLCRENLSPPPVQLPIFWKIWNLKNFNLCSQILVPKLKMTWIWQVLWIL